MGVEPWELRFTARALDDLGAASAKDKPGDIAAVRRVATYQRAVDDFMQKRKDRPDAPGEPLHDVGRPDIVGLHSAAGGRAATWHDRENHVVWFLGFTPNHEYGRFEDRAAAGDLLPDEDDEVQLELEREQRDFEVRVRDGLLELVSRATSSPHRPCRGLIGEMLRLELSAVVVPLGDEFLGDIWIVVHLPLQGDAGKVPGWPGSDLLETLAAIAGQGDGDIDYPSTIPTEDGWKPLDPAEEMAIVLQTVALPPL